jgi:hypothetical protein
VVQIRQLLRFAFAMLAAVAAIIGCNSTNDTMEANRRVAQVQPAPSDDEIKANRRAAREPLDLLNQAERFDLLSLDPNDAPNRTRKSDESFHGWDVLGTTTVTNVDVRRRLAAALRKGVDDSDLTAYNCFVPRHGIRFVHNGKRIEFVVCFKCLQVNVYVDGTETSNFLITSSPQATFNEALRAAGIVIAP